MFIFLASIRVAFIVTVLLAMIEVDLTAFMAIAEVKINAISIVNMIMALGMCSAVQRLFVVQVFTVIRSLC